MAHEAGKCLTNGRASRPGGKLGRWAAFAAVCCGALLIAIRYGQSDDSLTRVQRDRAIRVGYAVEAPYAFLTVGGEVTGEAPEIARRIAGRLGISRVDWRLTEFGSLVDGLELGHYDVIAAGIFVTPEREARVAFSTPTFQVRGGLLVQRGNPKMLGSYRAIANTQDVRIAVLTGSVEEKSLQLEGVPSRQVVSVPDARTGGALVEAGEVDGLALSAPTIRWMARNDTLGRTEIVESFDDGIRVPGRAAGSGAFAFRKEDAALRAAWDAELEKFVGGDEHRELVGRFGFTAAELPPKDTPGGRSARR